MMCLFFYFLLAVEIFLLKHVGQKRIALGANSEVKRVMPLVVDQRRRDMSGVEQILEGLSSALSDSPGQCVIALWWDNEGS